MLYERAIIYILVYETNDSLNSKSSRMKAMEVKGQARTEKLSSSHRVTFYIHHTNY